MNALLLVDLQYDFLPGGALAVPDGDQVLPVARRLVDRFPLVVATQDWHPADHASFAVNHPDHAIGDVIDLDGLDQVLWPAHCIQGTHGAELASEIPRAAVDLVVRKGQDPRIDSYSGFFDNGHRRETELRAELSARGVDAVWILGLATDYCVKFTALDAVQCGFRTHLVLSGCRGVELREGDCRRAVDAMRHAGVVMHDSEEDLLAV